MTKKEISYEDATTEIEEILSKLENDELNVDELTSNIKRVSKLLKITSYYRRKY
jgi:exodeoxyribonuclease VII small subunit